MEFARGLITYLFAVVTIGTTVVLFVFVLTNPDDPLAEMRFQRGKEVLSLLLGVFGTIVGFYFGSEVSAKNAEERNLRIAPLRLSAASVVSGRSLTVKYRDCRGKAPLRYAVVIGDGPAEPAEPADPGGWIVKESGRAQRR